MRSVLTLLVATSALAAVEPVRNDQVTLTDGSRLPATLTLTENGRLRFAATDRSAIAADRVQHIRFAPAVPVPFRAGVVHLVRLPGEQRLTGELLGLDARELRLRTAWRDRLAVPRSALVGVENLPGRLTIWDEDFENGLKAWKLAGSPKVSDKDFTSGTHSLLLDTPGQSAAYVLATPLEAGSAGVNFHVPAAIGGARWQLEAEFQGSAGPKVVRITLAGGPETQVVEAPSPRDAGSTVACTPGWHRLAVDFGTGSLLVTVDDAVLWYSRMKGPGGPLHEVRLICSADKGPLRGAVALDEFTLTAAVTALKRPDDGSSEDEAWLASGDQLFGRLTRLDRRRFELEGRFGKRSYSWAEARGVFPQRPAAATTTTEGAQVRVWLRPAAGTEPDELEGVLRGLDERRVVLRHAALGDLEIDRARLLRLQPLFHGRRIELDNGRRHLGEKGRLVPGAQPARAEGPRVEYTVRLAERPKAARLVLTLFPLDGRAEVLLNGLSAADLGKYAGRGARTAVPVAVPLPGDSLKAGENVVELRIGEEAGRRGSCVVSGVRLEIPE